MVNIWVDSMQKKKKKKKKKEKEKERKRKKKKSGYECTMNMIT